MFLGAEKTKTRGFFSMESVSHHPVDMSFKNRKNLLTLNPTIKAYLDKQQRMEERKLKTSHEARSFLQECLNKEMVKQDKKVIRSFRQQVKEEW